MLTEFRQNFFTMTAQAGNPDLNWCYGDESAIGEVAKSAHAATV